jgi:hypothetical protein
MASLIHPIGGVDLAVRAPAGPMASGTLSTASTGADGVYRMRVTFDGDGIFCEPGWLELVVAIPAGWAPAASEPDFRALRCTTDPQVRDLAFKRQGGA